MSNEQWSWPERYQEESDSPGDPSPILALGLAAFFGGVFVAAVIFGGMAGGLW